MKKQLKLLICRIDRIGDVVLSTPIPREVKKQFPDSFIAVLVRGYTKDVYLNSPYVDEIIIYDKETYNSKSGFWSLVKEIKKHHFTHAFMLLPDKRLNMILFFSAIKNRFGVGHKLYQFLTFTKYVDRKKYIPLRHEADYCLDMARRIGVTVSSTNPEIVLTEDEKKFVENLRVKLLAGRKYIVGINITSGNSAPNLLPSEYKKITEVLTENNDLKVIITDNNPPAELLSIDGVEYPNLNKPLRESILTIASLDLMISASTGPMHIAAALKVKTLSLFCPLTACSPELWGPLGNNSKIILPEDNYCSTFCPGDPKKCNYEGPGGIDHKTVIEQALSFLES